MRAKLRDMMGHFEDSDSQEVYSLATLLDPRYSTLLSVKPLSIIRYKDTFFIDPENAAAAKEKLIRIVKFEVDMDDNEPFLVDRSSSSSEPPVEDPAKKVSIMEQISKKIRLDKEQRVRGGLCMCSVYMGVLRMRLCPRSPQSPSLRGS